MADIFLSYARADVALAERIALELETRGWSVFWDRRVAPGQQWEQILEQEIAGARCMIVLWSRSSVDSRWVKAEASEALDRGILIPALIGDTRPPLGYRNIEAAHLSDWRPGLAHAEFDDLVDAVSDVLAGRRVAPLPTDRPVEKLTLRRTYSAALVLTLFVAAGFWLTRARPGVLGVGPHSWSTATALVWLGVLLMALGVFIGTRLVHGAHRPRIAIKALSSAIAVGTVLVAVYVAVDDARGESLKLGFQSVIMMPSVWIVATMMFPMRHRHSLPARIGVLALAIAAAVLIGDFIGSKDNAAWFFATLTPLVLVLVDWIAEDAV